MLNRTKIKPRYMLLLSLVTFIFSVAYYIIGNKYANSPLTYYQYIEFTSLIAIIIVGGYQIFFWVQRNNYFFRTRCLKTKFDEYIPFWPSWVWAYSFLYYLIIGLVVVSIKSIEQGVNIIFGGLLLLFLQLICFIFFPCTVPPEWRKYKLNSVSTKYLKFVQGLDNGRNCFPSMHCSVATYTILILMPLISYYSFMLLLLIIISCLFVKQHQIADIVPGVLLGWIVYAVVIA